MKIYTVLVVLLVLPLVVGMSIRREESKRYWEPEVTSDKRATRVKNGYTLITTDLGGGKFKCKCIDPKGRQIWPGACGSYDKTFGFINCV